MNPFTRFGLVACLGSALILAGAFFRIMHWKHSHWLLLAGLGLTVFDGILFFTSRTKFNGDSESISGSVPAGKKVGPLLIFAIVCLVIGAVFAFIGAVFKIMHWPGSTFAFLACGISLAIGIALIVAWSVIKQRKKII